MNFLTMKYLNSDLIRVVVNIKQNETPPIIGMILHLINILKIIKG